jgi:hypothetical protein
MSVFVRAHSQLLRLMLQMLGTAQNLSMAAK